MENKKQKQIRNGLYFVAACCAGGLYNIVAVILAAMFARQPADTGYALGILLVLWVIFMIVPAIVLIFKILQSWKEQKKTKYPLAIIFFGYLAGLLISNFALLKYIEFQAV